ncbi:M20 family metallopeptidase [Sphaerobacter thermophilus]|uniref:Peptidase M20 domain-containing protein 2 n=1 Tax=Sphaerobacter thermophilus (strain ATCC 49802 / DSM 20745 / KCCM 41009 / NCIMB 13125 / S 6022) TaxID=479434 RepID=D1C200_SPHTD|nr:M20 family metallopeptidase [Sphaerobacter thermophilus]ACZ38267.1 amidohydrolase [Sphaerobacter thermophilus DSM 20745]
MSTTGNLEAAREAVLAAIDAERDNLIALSKFIHANPEVALQEVKSSAACADFLAERGFSVERGVADLPTAFHASKGDGRPHVGYLSEYDALPGVGHGCGHNLIAIAGIGAGIGLAAALPHVGGRVSVFGTPAEEAIGGKVIMARAGVFSGLDAAMGAHPGTSEAAVPYLEGSGQALACQGVRIAFHGKAAHAAADPHNGINALNALIETFNGINALRQHIKDEARIHGIITQGGQAPNVVPDYAEGSFLVRASTRAYMQELVDKVRAIAEGAASMTGARLTFERSEEPYYDMITNYPLARRIKKHLDDLGLQLPDPKVEPGKGSTDWGNVSYEVPSVETSYPIVDRVITWHSKEVVEAADSELGYANTLTVAKALALAGLDVLTDAALRAEIGLAFERERAARA